MPRKAKTKSDNKKKSIDAIIRSVSKQFGDEAIMLGTDIPFGGEVISTGSMLIDQAIGVGGIPLGKIVEIYGENSSGKTTLSSSIIAQAQKAGLICAYFDAEATYDRTWAEKIGVNLEELLFVETTSLEDCLDKMSLLVEKGVDLLVLDSYAALPAEAEIKGNAGDANIAAKTRVLSQWFRTAPGMLRDYQSSIIFINQVRVNIGTYGNPETTPGGKSLHHIASLRIRLSKKPIRQKKEVIGTEISAYMVKNKLARPYKRATTTLLFDKGFDSTHEVIQLAVELGYIERGGAWYSPVFLLGPNDSKDDLEKQQGIETMQEWIIENGHYAALETLVRDNMSKVIGIEEDIDSLDEDEVPDF